MRPNWCDENTRTRTIWSDDDILQALVLWTTSRPAYRYLYSRRILPLPSERTLQQRFEHIQLPPGFLDAIDEVLTVKAALLSPKERVVHLSMDEVRKKPSQSNLITVLYINKVKSFLKEQFHIYAILQGWRWV